MKDEIQRLKERVLKCGGEVLFGDIDLGDGAVYVGNCQKPIVTACPFSETEEIRIRAVKVDEKGNIIIIGEFMDGEIIDPMDVNDIYEGEIDNITDSIEMEEKTIWLRLGVTVKGTEKEITQILENGADAGETLWNILEEKRFEIDGETYIPASTVEDYNAENGTEFEAENIEFVF